MTDKSKLSWADKQVTKFEDLIVWQKAHKFYLKCYDFREIFPSYEQYNLWQQLIRAAGSIPANITEGFGRYYFKEFIQFLRNARGSLEETRYWLRVARDRSYITEERWKKDNEELISIRVLINKLIASLQELLNKER